jgi:hypothetical protein
MKKYLILLILPLLVSCASLSSLNPFASKKENPAESEAAKSAYRNPKEIICRYNKEALDLPIKFDTFRALDANSLTQDPRLSVPIDNDKRKILSINLKYECLCSSTERKKELECEQIESTGAELNESKANPNFDDGISK